MSSISDDLEADKDKRGPGRPKDSGEYPAIVHLRLTSAQDARLRGLAAAAKCNRSEALRRLILTGYVSETRQPGAATCYRQAANLDTGLCQLRQLPGLSVVAQQQVSALLEQVEQLMTALNNPQT